MKKSTSEVLLRPRVGALVAFARVGRAMLLAIYCWVPVGSATACDTTPHPPTYGYTIVAAWPHDNGAYTQGLVVDDGILYESTGRYGASSLRIVDLKSGGIIKRVDLPDAYFGEGIAILGNKIFQLTWRERKGFVYDRRTLKRLGEFHYTGEGWGLTSDGTSLIMSDGTDTLRYFDPLTFRISRRLRVHDCDGPIDDLNELEFVDGEILANVWRRDVIARIDPQSGRVRGWIDLHGLQHVDDKEAVLNGIAYDKERNRLLVTGKLWPKLFQIQLREPARVRR